MGPFESADPGTGPAGVSSLALAPGQASSLVPSVTLHATPPPVLCVSSPRDPALEEEEDSLSVGLDVRPPSSPRSPGVVCYACSPGTPPSPALGSPALVPTTPPPPSMYLALVTPPAGGSKVQSGPSLTVAVRQSVRLSRSRTLQDGRVPTIPEKAAIRAAARDLIPGISPGPPGPSCSGSRFAILGSVPLAHLADVASDCDVVFRGEKGPRLEQISAICDKEMLDGALAEARARAERGDLGAPVPTDPGHIEAGVGKGPVGEVSGAVNLGGPPQWRTLRGRPPKRLHPTEHQMVVRGASVGAPALEPLAADAPVCGGVAAARPSKLPDP